MGKNIIITLAYLVALFSSSIALGAEAVSTAPQTVRGADTHIVNATAVKNPSRAEMRTRVRAYRDAMRAAVQQTDGVGAENKH